MKRTDILSVAKRHAITRDVASPDFFEGALMGNGCIYEGNIIELLLGTGESVTLTAAE